MIETTLYKKAKTGKIQVYTSWTETENRCSESGELGGKLTPSRTTCYGKNIGKANETTPAEQAILECEAKRQKKLDTGYFKTKEEAETEEVFLPMLAAPYKARASKIVYPCNVQPKLDGVRCMAPTTGLMSRGGKLYDVMHIDVGMESYRDNIVCDGELYIHGMPLQDLVSLVKKPKEGSENVEYWIYDVYLPGNKQAEWWERLIALQKVKVALKTGLTPKIKVVPTYIVEDEEEMKEMHDQFVQEGYEGIIIRETHGTYELGHRSRHLIKYKEFIDAEFEIINYKGGVGKFEECVTWVCVTEDEKVFDCTPKGTLEQKREWYANASKFMGKKLTVRYQALTNSGKPQFPVGISIRDYE